MPVFINEQQITLSQVNTWETVSLSSIVPAEAEVVLLRFKNAAGDTIRMAVRCKGSTDNHLFGADPGQKDLALHWQACKVNVNREIEIFRGSTVITAYIYGYLKKSEVVGFTNLPIINPAVTNQWHSVSLNSIIPSGTGKVYGALVHPIYTTNNAGLYGIRHVGSSNNILNGQTGTVCGLQTVTLNALNEMQIFNAAGGTIAFFIVGLLKKDILKMYNAPVNVTPSLTTGVYQDIVTLPRNGVAGIFQITSTGRQFYNLRGKNLTVTAPSGTAELHVHAGIVPVGENNTIQGLRNSTGISIFQTGYWKLEEQNQLFNGVNF